MKIVAVTTHVVSHRLDVPFGMSQWDWDSRASCLVEIRTDDGLTGWGECFGPAPGNRALIDGSFAPFLLGRDPRELTDIWDELYNRNREWGRKGISIAAISGIEIALWDLAGKAAGLPVWRLLGGKHTPQVRAYASAFYYGGDWKDDIEAEAHSIVDAGYRDVKMKVGRELTTDIERVRRARAALGPSVRIAVDANRGYTTAEAKSFLRALEDADLWFFEEPVLPEDLQGYREIRAGTTVPIAGGESEFTRWGFRELIETRAVDLLQPDATACGGIRATLLIAGMASAHGIPTLPHVWGSSITIAAGLHLLTALPQVTPSTGRGPVLVELDQAPNPFRSGLAGLATGPVLSVPDGPGLGIEIDRELLGRYAA
ncbi:mandelate racemase/muconate lactonizing enzyme family protein [Amycolatopsis acidicola]|uniref:Mandelate racemase/muconate lactonizing enzyme family protein n=1 Tax=Amycolatopsis acidicola TaxID=2596893 RepID=A0A5N0V0G8_9PSEU|nr:mandelate racemase/muconate lactonizing enzyme family protein [Amycolatopsis acidicola]KAA9159062.1 mandelate racemase/muconate lactonizing enzyme family protein [Amycolatopsis acidicola]